MPGQRITWMDLARGICILLVVILHASSALSERAGIATPEPIRMFNAALQPYRMTLLMFLSGMLLGRSLDKPAGPYVSGKLAQIYWPFLVWSMVTLWAEDRLTLEYILKTPISAPTLLWYLWFLCAYYILALGMNRLRIPVLPVIAASLVASAFLPDFVRAPRFAFLFAFFLLGHFCASRAGAITVPRAAGALGLLLAAAGGWLSIRGVPVRYEPAYAWAPFGLILGVLWLAPLYRSGSAAGNAVEWVGRNSIVFYVMHFPVQCVVVWLMVRQGWDDFAVIYPVTLLSALLAAVAMQALRERSALAAGLFDFRRLRELFPSRVPKRQT